MTTPLSFPYPISEDRRQNNGNNILKELCTIEQQTKCLEVFDQTFEKLWSNIREPLIKYSKILKKCTLPNISKYYDQTSKTTDQISQHFAEIEKVYITKY